MQIHNTTTLACVEVGGGSVQTVLFGGGGDIELLDGAHQPDGSTLAFAVPGFVENGLVHATNLGWRDIDPVKMFELAGPAVLVLNDAEAAALGEAAIREDMRCLVYLCLGTGIGGAVVSDGRVLKANLFGHNADGYGTSFGDEPCRCGRFGCLETVAAGWALPDPLDELGVTFVGRLLSEAIASHELARKGTIVIGGGMARRYPQLVDIISSHLYGRSVEGSLAPAGAKSAAAWGLRYATRVRNGSPR